MFNSAFISYVISFFLIIASFLFWYIDSIFYSSVDDAVGIIASVLNFGIALSIVLGSYHKRFRYLTLLIIGSNFFIYLQHIFRHIKKCFLVDEFHVYCIYSFLHELIWLLIHLYFIRKTYLLIRVLRKDGYNYININIEDRSDVNKNTLISLRVFLLLAFLAANAIYINTNEGMLSFFFPEFVHIHFIMYLGIIFLNFAIFNVTTKKNKYISTRFSLLMIMITIVIHNVVSFLNFATQW